MADKKVSAEEIAKANSVFHSYHYDKDSNVSAKEKSDALNIIFKKMLEDTRDEPMFFCDTVIYSVLVQLIIMGTLIPLYIHLQKDNDYFFYLRFVIGIQLVFLLAEIVLFNHRYSGRVMGSISHMLGIVAIILHLRLISPVLAMCVGIPVSLWIFVTIIYHCVAVEVEATNPPNV